MGIFLGLAAAIGWGTGDFLVRGATRSVGSFRSLLYMQLFGATFIVIIGLLTGNASSGLGVVTAPLMIIILLEALVSLSGTAFLYKSFSVGVLAIVSPIASSYAAVTLILSLLSGERLTEWRTIGILCALIGVILASIEHHSSDNPHPDGLTRRAWRTPPGVGFAIGAAIAYGIAFWINGFYIIPVVGGFTAVLILRCVSLLLLPVIGLLTRQKMTVPHRRAALILLSVGIIDTLAFLAASLGAATEQVSVVTVMSSLFSAWTVLLAWVFLRERPSRIQWIGIVLIMVGIALVSVG
jgi:drug/metabolite transporter (DMT)-like permease